MEKFTINIMAKTLFLNTGKMLNTYTNQKQLPKVVKDTVSPNICKLEPNH